MNRREFLRALLALPIAIPFVKLPEIEAVEQATLELDIVSPSLLYRKWGGSMIEGLETGLKRGGSMSILGKAGFEYTFDDYVIDWNYPD